MYFYIVEITLYIPIYKMRMCPILKVWFDWAERQPSFLGLRKSPFPESTLYSDPNTKVPAQTAYVM